MTRLADAEQAARSGNLTQLKSFLEKSPDVLSDRDGDNDTLLGLACRAATGDIAIPPDPGTTAQHAAVDMILNAGADPDAAAKDGWAPLHTAAMAGHINLTTRLLAAGASLEGHLYQASGGSPLALALFYAKTEVAEILAAPAVPDNLRHAAAMGNALDRFFENGTLTMQASEGLDFYGPLIYFPIWERTYSSQEILDEALTWAARNGQVGSMEQLLTRGAGVNSNPFRGTPLLWAIYNDNIEAATWLLDNGADPNLRHDFGGEGHGVAATAIHLAAQFDAVRSIQLLLDRGADPHIVDGAHGGDAVGWAEFSGAQNAAVLLKEWVSRH